MRKIHYKKLIFPLIGLAAFIWFLIRVIPKPSRAAYPCQRAAFPIAAGFIIWLTGLLASAPVFIRLRKSNLLERKYLVPVFVLGGMFFTFTFLPQDSILADTEETTAKFIPPEDPNEVSGTGRGIHPGRVTWVFNPDAVLYDGYNGKFWEEDKIDQEALDAMFTRSLSMLTGIEDPEEAWEALFIHFNHKRGKGSNGYEAGEKIAIKINMNTANSHTDSDAYSNTTPHAVLSLTRQLVYNAGVPEEAITYFDRSRPVTNYVYNYVKTEFPGVKFMDQIGGDGRLKFQTDSAARIFWSQPLTLEVGGGHDTYLPKTVSEADYIINLGNLKGHDLAGISICAKNHVGTLIATNPDNTNLSSPRAAGIHPYIAVHDFAYWDLDQREYATYNTLVDMMGHKDLGEKTLLFVVDGLFGTQTQHAIVNNTQVWFSDPFNIDFTSSVFMSQDGVALESVALDFMRNENSLNQVNGTVDNYLHEAAMANDPPSGVIYDPENDGIPLESLGTHEHWNHEDSRKYSVNLGTGNGIELVSYRYGPQPVKTPESLAAIPFEDTLIRLTWSDLSDNETFFEIERSDRISEGFYTIANAGIDRTYYHDRDFSSDATVHYRIRAYGPNGYSGYSDTVSIVFSTVGLEDQQGGNLRVYPNPAGEYLIIETGDYEKVYLVDLQGRILLRRGINSPLVRMEIPEVFSGNYILVFEKGSERIQRPILIQ